ncbi:fatty acid desaturase family protein [Arenimonas sp. MALMAid1274]|uniref:fatty acid desaturase family protein n=1 Tax=Arenimonas sp. MALMAid1274 TaxID=3411630 RepID=UPI003B9E3260
MPKSTADRPLSQPSPFAGIDLKAFAADVEALHRSLKSDLGQADLVHLRRMARWSRMLTVLGYAVAWIVPNPVAALLMGLGNMGRWTCVTHPVMHRGYDAVPGVPAHYTSKRFAMGWRRWLDWLDWLHPDAWAHEHNQLHHFQTGQQGDPDLVERNAWFIRHRRVPRPVKALIIVLVMMTWKLTYYAPNTFFALKQHRRIRAQTAAQARAHPLPAMGEVACLVIPGERVMLPVTAWGIEFWLRCVLPYGLVRFGLIPALFLPLGTWAWMAVLVNSLLAEVVANVVTFVTIAPNHTGDDLYRFDSGCRSRGEFYLQQCAGSVNYPGGTDVQDYLQGYLNYQIEHHVWPDLPLLKYRQAAPRLKAICRKHGVPYVEESVFRRFGRLWSIMMGDTSMRRAGALAVEPAARADLGKRIPA